MPRKQTALQKDAARRAGFTKREQEVKLVGEARNLQLGDMTFEELDAEIRARIAWIKRERKAKRVTRQDQQYDADGNRRGSRTQTTQSLPSHRVRLVEQDLRRYYAELERRLGEGLLDDVAPEPPKVASPVRRGRLPKGPDYCIPNPAAKKGQVMKSGVGKTPAPPTPDKFDTRAEYVEASNEWRKKYALVLKPSRKARKAR